MIPEPQLTYVLELLAALGPAADDFVVAGAQAMKFTVAKARGTKDVDFILNVIALRKEPVQLAKVFERLGYTAVLEFRNFQFVKPIPNSSCLCNRSALPWQPQRSMSNSERSHRRAKKERLHPSSFS